jgi:hypothetical protein
MKADIHFCLVSAQATPNVTPALDPNFRPREAVLLVSPDMAQRATWVEGVLRENSVRSSRVALKDAWDIEHIRDTVLEWLAVHEGESVALNATGGTKPMSIAAYEVFRASDKPIFYVHPELDRVLWLFPQGEPSYDLADKIRLKAFCQAHGATVVEPGNRQGVPEALRRLTEGLINNAEKYAKAMRTLNWAAHQAEREKSLNSPQISLQQQGDDFLSLVHWFEQANLLSFQRDRLTFADENARFFVNGGWLEAYVYGECLSLKRQDMLQDIARGLVVERETQHGTVRNELDIAFLKGNKLYVIECKTKFFGASEQDPGGANALYKLDSLRDLIGGLQARAMLASYHGLSDADRRRADDLRIRLCLSGQLREMKSVVSRWLSPSASIAT